MKLTRSEKAAVSVVKVANAMYKAAKAPTQEEFFWDERDYLEGWYDQYSSNYVLATSSGKILAHFWLYQTTEGGYVIDSVEARSSMDVDILTDLVAEWVDVALDKAHIFISDCGYGITQQVIKKLREDFTLIKEDEPRAAFDPVSHYSYRDSRNGVFFIE